MSEIADSVHFYQPGSGQSDRPVLLLLHGTGGNERDLLPLAKRYAPESAVLGLRGDVLENGMARFFRRLAEGVFDEEDLVKRTDALHAFLNVAAQHYGFDRQQVVAIGYSNGANIAASLLLHHAHSLRGAVLHHPMVPTRNVALPVLSRIPVFIGAGEHDTICSPEETRALQAMLVQAEADVTVHWAPSGHRLTESEVEQAAGWFAQKFPD